MRPEILLPPSTEYALRIRHKVKSGFRQDYLLIGDCHWDSPECYLRLLHKHLREAVDRDALIIDNGDFFEVISSRDDPRGSKGTIREEHSKVNYLDALVKDALEEFRPYLNRIVYMGTGNHEMAIMVRRETDMTGRFVDAVNLRKLNTPGIHRANYTGWIRFMFECPNGSHRNSLFAKLEHGSGGNSPVTKGTIGANRRAARTEGATFFVSSHIHEQWALSGVIETVNLSSGRVEQRKAKHIQLGAYRRDFRNDGVGTWIMQKSGAPKPVGGSWLTFRSPNGNDVEWSVEDTWVDYPNLNDYLVKTAVKREKVA